MEKGKLKRKQYRTKPPLSVFLVEVKTAPNNKDTFNGEYIQQCELHTFLHNLVNVLVQIANKVGLRRKFFAILTVTAIA
jgi:hypothetical protein